jgi:hypothetical protein
VYCKATKSRCTLCAGTVGTVRRSGDEMKTVGYEARYGWSGDEMKTVGYEARYGRGGR